MTSEGGNASDALLGTYCRRFTGGTKAGSADWMLGGRLCGWAPDEPFKRLFSRVMLTDVKFEMILSDTVVEAMS